MSAITGPGEWLNLSANEGQCRILSEGFDLADRNPWREPSADAGCQQDITRLNIITRCKVGQRETVVTALTEQHTAETRACDHDWYCMVGIGDSDDDRA